MPIDIESMPSAETREARPPRAVIWLLLAVIIVGGGVFLALWCWPAGWSTHDVRFWIFTAVLPLFVFGLMLTARWYAYDQERLRIVAYNRQREYAVDHNASVARRPLALLASTYVTALGNKKVAARIIAGDSALHYQPVRGIGKAASHSSIIAQTREALTKDNRRTQFDALPLADDDLLELFGQLIDALRERLVVLRPLVALPVQLFVSGNQYPLDVETQWAQAWASFGLGRFVLEVKPAEVGSMSLDAWLDETDRSRRERVALFVNVQLRDDPPAGSGEVATALLVAWPDLLPRIGLSATSWLHRPVRASGAPEDKALETALTWGRVGNVNDARIWACGLDTHSRLTLSALQDRQSDKPETPATTGAIDAADIEARMRSLSDIDTALGEAGHASSWLACALAAEAACDTAAPQLIATRDATGTSYAVVRPANQNNTQSV